MSVTSVFDIHLRPESVPGAYRVVRQVAAQTRAQAGNTGLDLLLDRSDPAHLLVIGSWGTAEQFAAYERWRRGEGAPVELGALLSMDPTTSVFAGVPGPNPVPGAVRVPGPTAVPVRTAVPGPTNLPVTTADPDVAVHPVPVSPATRGTP